MNEEIKQFIFKKKKQKHQIQIPKSIAEIKS